MSAFALPVTLSVTALVTQETVACSKSLTRGCFAGLAPIYGVKYYFSIYLMR